MPRTLLNLVATGAVLVVPTLVVPTLVAATQAAADRIYMPVDLGTLGGDESVALAMNDRGMVVGWADTGHAMQQAHAFLWVDDQMEDLGTLGGAWSEGRAINDLGVVVGAAETPDGEQHAFVWYDGVMHNLTELLRVPPADLTKLGDPRGCHGQIRVFVEANDINENGWIVGCALMEGDPSLHGILAVPSFVGPPPAVDPGYFYVDLGRVMPDDECLAMGVSDTDMVVGISGDTAFVWMDQTIEPLEPAPTLSFAGDVNDAGAVVGWTQPFDPGYRRMACMWLDGVRRDLAGFEDGVSNALAINDAELIVGYAAEGPGAPHVAMLWEGCLPYNLNDITVVPVRSVLLPWRTLTEATDIDSADRIVGFGTSSNGRKRAVLLFDPTDRR